MKRAGVIASVFSVIIGLVTWVVWPLPLYRDYIFTKSVSLVPFFSSLSILPYLMTEIIVLFRLDGCLGDMAFRLPARCVRISRC